MINTVTIKPQGLSKHALPAKTNFCPLLLLTGLFFCINSAAQPVQPPATYPIAMTFRAFDNLKLGTEAFNRRLDEQAPYPFIHAARPDEAATIIHKRWPDKIVTFQDAYGGISPSDYEKVWPGHLLYRAGTLINHDVAPQDTALVVKDPMLIVKNNKSVQRINKKVPFSLIIYALDNTGKPDWSQAEHVVVEAIKGGQLTVKRGQWGSKPLSFKAGKAVVAAHMMFWTRQWQVNFGLQSPRGGKDNLSGAEWYARHIAQRLAAADANGVEFDVARWTWSNTKDHPMDVNNDLVTDYGYIDGVNSFGLGGQVFFRELRKQVGPDKIIQADSNDDAFGVRGWRYLNGIQMESFPAANHFDRFSPAFLHLRLWAENAEAIPHISYPFTKTPTTIFANAKLPDGRKTDFRFRVGLAAACLTGMPHPFATLQNIKFDPANPKLGKEENNEQMGVFNWDEYHGGDLNDWHWLGRPVGSAQQDLSDLDKTDLLAKSAWQWNMATGFNTEHKQTANEFSAQVKNIPAGIPPDKMWYGVQLAPKQGGLRTLQKNRQYTVEFQARGDDTWHYAGQTFERVPRMIAISGAVNANKQDTPITVLADSTLRTYRVSFTADGSPTPVFGVAEQTGTTEIRNIKLYAGGAERWSREFEKGLVLLNMTDNPWRVAMKKGVYRHLKGSQAPEVNNGQPVENEIVVPAQDALFLVKR
ncbi:MAG: hypothetical protein PHR16_05300 [Methylovulum sp.]|nr:hypothetical protein [Methylovulum sp.]